MRHPFFPFVPAAVPVPVPGLKHYDVLGVSRAASAGDIRDAYTSRARAAHPDKGGDNEVFQAVSEAYSVLSNPELRRAYDFGGDAAVSQARHAPPPPPIHARVHVTLQQAYTGTSATVTITRDGVPEAVHVTVPRGVTHGFVICVPQVGNMGPNGIRGHVLVHVECDKTSGAYARLDDASCDVCVEITVPLWKALAGGCVTLPPLPWKNDDDAPVVIVPSRTMKATLELPCAGLPVLNSATHFGSILVHVTAVMPTVTDVCQDTVMDVVALLGGTVTTTTHSPPLPTPGVNQAALHAREAAQQDALRAATDDLRDNNVGGGGGGVQHVQCAQQ